MNAICNIFKKKGKFSKLYYGNKCDNKLDKCMQKLMYPVIFESGSLTRKG